MPIRPLHNRLAIRRAEAASQTRSGLFIPDQAQERPVRATVVAVGARRDKKTGNPLPALVAVGDEILVGKYAGIEYRDPDTGELLALIDDEEVMGHFVPPDSSLVQVGDDVVIGAV